MLECKQSTTVTFQLGPAVDTSGVPVTTLTIANTDVLLCKHNATSWGNKNESSSPTHSSTGMYTCTLNSTDTSTAGRLQIICYKSGAVPMYHEIQVRPANAYDSLSVGTDTLEVDVVALAGDTTAATLLYRINSGSVLAQAVTGTLAADEFTTNIATGTFPGASTDNFFNGRSFVFVTGDNKGQGGTINDYVGATKKIVCDTLSNIPANNDYFVII